jgi:hypothetical protein
MVLSLKPLASSRAQGPRRLATPHSSAMRVIETPEDGVGAYVAPHSDNPDGTVWLYEVVSANLYTTYET